MLNTLAEIKAYLNITDTNSDSILTTIKASAESKLDTLTNRKLSYQSHTEYFTGNGTKEKLLDEFPVESVTSIHYYDTSTEAYVDIFTDGGSIAANVEIQSGGKIILRGDFEFALDAEYKIVYVAGYKATKTYKTITAIAQDNVDATLTKITIGAHSYTAGTVFYIEGVTGFLNNPNGAFVINSVSSTIVYIVHTLGTGSYTSGATAEFDSALANTTPDDLKQVLYEITADLFYRSPTGKGWFGLNSKNVGGDTFNLQDIDFNNNPVIQKYKKINV